MADTPQPPGEGVHEPLTAAPNPGPGNDPLAGADEILRTIDDAPLADQPAVFEQLHARLQRALEATARATGQ